MIRRQPEYILTCAHPGCREKSAIKLPHRPDWKCSRHSAPNERLSTTNLSTTAEWELFENWTKETAFTPSRPYGNSWGPSEAGKGRAGLVSGPGFTVSGADFPPGTRLIVTTQIVLPEDTPTREQALATLAREWSTEEYNKGPIWRDRWRWAFDSAARLLAADGIHPPSVASVVGELRAFVDYPGVAGDRRTAAALVADALDARANARP